MLEITFIAFNYGNAGQVVNGPGMCLVNFVKKLKKLNVIVNVFSQLKSQERNAFPLSDFSKLSAAIKRSDILHHWSGISEQYVNAINFAKSLGKKVIIGPNVLDLVEFKKESNFLNKVSYHKILTVNERLKFLLSKNHNIPLKYFDLLLVGPDTDLWAPLPRSERNRKILWKGNGKQFVKDVNFGLEVAKKLDKYQFEFIGYPEPYGYYSHIPRAKSCHLYFSTSYSETMGACLVESWASKLPSITHPKIYLHGQNYQTGIITNRDINSYSEAIEEIMENDQLYEVLSQGAQDYVNIHFSNAAQKYLDSLR